MNDVPPSIAPEAAAPAFSSDKPRSRRIELEWPVEYGGRTYQALVIQRVTTDQIAAWTNAVRKKDPNANLGNVVDDDGAPVPTAVLEFLDPDDNEEVGEAIESFLPRRLREAFTSDQETSTSS
ncbi:hypothetical protein [Methylobacterium sp. A54F]